MDAYLICKNIFLQYETYLNINLSKHVYLVSINYMSIAQERYLSWKTKCYCYIKENIYGLQRMDYLHTYWVCLSKGNSNQQKKIGKAIISVINDT